MDPDLLSHAAAARGFMPSDEGLALHDAAAGVVVEGPFLEIGSYCGKSAVYIGAAAQANGRVLFALDHHRGSEENQPGWKHHEPDLVDLDLGKLDTLGRFRRTVHDAGLEDTVVGLVGDSGTIGQVWRTPLALLFIDGGHGHDPAHRDYELWVRHLVIGGTLLIHDVFPDPLDGGRPPYEIYCRATESGAFREVGVTGSLRHLVRIAASA